MPAIERQPDLLGVYIHFPFCIQKCHYCDFYSLSIREVNCSIDEIEKLFVKRIIEELKFRLSYFEHYKQVNTIYFGGGTSSFLSPNSIEMILNEISKYYSFVSSCEITVEGNPEHFHQKEYLQSLKKISITRINVGIQTKNQSFLKEMNRYFDYKHYEVVLERVANQFDNWGIDLIYGYPNQNFEEFIEDLNWVLSYPVKHLSLYALTLEKGTPYENLVRQKKLLPPNELLQEEIFLKLPELLKSRKFYPYEISNYSLKGYECRHNLRYWLYEPYLGLGPSAHGFNGTYRYNNFRNWDRWLTSFSEQYIKHEPEKEIAITIFRLLIPISMKWIAQITNKFDLFYQFFQQLELQRKGYFLKNGEELYFQWNYQETIMLNDILIEFFDLIEKEATTKS
ncbi:MAG: radical SAM family heme chaperone HemW [Leptospiraceae bacterium]|nr:radical SAM family heme chaperone HemW [Leptospiraceae bacterium]MDW7976091.1 radical SAM family heme chaperone HemW [Leptospiraceae bacterium]